MSKKLLNLLSSFVLIGVLLPSVSLAVAGTYGACEGEIKKDGTCDGTEISVCYEGFVPCGLGKPYWKEGIPNGNCKCQVGDPTCKKPGGVSCQFCHFFVMINGIVKFILINVVPYLAVLMLVIGGIMFYFAHVGGLEMLPTGAKGGPKLLSQGKKLINGVIIGLFLIYGSYLIVGTFLSVLGVSEWTGLTNWAAQGPFSIDCPIEIP